MDYVLKGLSLGVRELVLAERGVDELLGAYISPGPLKNRAG